MADQGAAVAAALRTWLAARCDVLDVAVTGRATVGLSQETWFAEVTTGDGSVPVVVRLPTPASGGRAIVTQRAALQAVAGSAVPAPAVLWHDDGGDNPFGRPVLVMERIAGTVPAGWHEVAEPTRTRLAEQAVDVLAALHELDVDAAELPVRDPAPTELAWYQHHLARLGDPPPVLRAGLWWLERHAPSPPPRRVLVHGDFRMGNLVVDGERLRGVLDWEMAAPGDPLADLTWCFLPVWELPGVDEPALLARYAARTGATLDEERLRWHRVLGYVRLSYYALSGSRAFATGRSDDLRLAALRLQLPIHLDRLAATLAGEPVT
ncbi:MAG TPA: phosphotransferase family protein [Egibacteraceae bacterium]